MAYTLSGVHKLYASQLIAVMVKEESVKASLHRVKLERTRIRRVLAITSFTRFWNWKKNPKTVQFCISSRSVGVSRSQ